MKRIGLVLLTVLMVLTTMGIVFWTNRHVAATSPSDYSGTPPFISSTVAPNVLLLMDNSGSMTQRATCQVQPCTPFDPTQLSTGLFQSTQCYFYDTANNRFVIDGSSKLFSDTCLVVTSSVNTTDKLWDGNFLNWITLRRFDALKIAMIGGDCYVVAPPPATGRDVDGTCLPSGNPALKTIRGQILFAAGAGNEPSTPATPPAVYNGRMPAAVANGAPNIFFQLQGGTAGMQGSFCVDDDFTLPSGKPPTSCTDPDAFVESQFFIRAVVPNDATGNPIEPTGVIQQLGDKARFGLMEFRGTDADGDGKVDDGARVLTPIGGRQSIDFTGAGLQTFNTNKSAMIASVERSFPKTNTPLAESLLDAVLYVAQVNSFYVPTSYTFPLAFTPGNALGAGGTGSLGAGELGGLTGSETCPTGYITGACGRDPYFFASDHSPAWASPSTVVSCCKTFIIVMTDGSSTVDSNVPNSLQEYAASITNTPSVARCTGNPPAPGPPPVPGTGTALFSPPETISPPPPTSPILASPQTLCYDGTNTVSTIQNPPPGTGNQPPPAGKVDRSGEASILLHQHKTDYLDQAGNHSGSHFLDDVAYWAHTNDLRQATIPVLNIPGHDLPGIQNVTVYTLLAFGTIDGRELLMQAARQGGFEDSNNNNIPDLASEFDKVDNVTGVAVPDGIPDTFFEAKDTVDLQEKILAAITSILQKAASGTSVSVLATSSTGEGAIYQAFFFPSTFNTVGSVTTEVTWTGFVQGLFIDTFGNLREDYSAPDCTGPPDGKLVLKHDCIVKIRFDAASNQVKVDRFTDSNGDGIADDRIPDGIISDGFTDTNGDGFINSVQSPCNPATSPPCPANTPLDAPSDAIASVFLTTGSISNIQPIWEGGRRLALTNPGATCAANSGGSTCRRILTWADFNNDGGVTSAGPGMEYDEFSAATPARVAALCPYLGGVAVTHCNDNTAGNLSQAVIDGDATLHTIQSCVNLSRQQCAQQEATAIINFVRGCDPLDTLPECMNGGKSTVAGLRPRQLNIKDDNGAIVTDTWKLGDIINSTPVVEGAPRERFDVIYGDADYARFFQRYKDRRQVAYVGANDGMLHAFNAGFLEVGDDPTTPAVEQLQFTLIPQQADTGGACVVSMALPCDANQGTANTYPIRTNSASLKRGAELWAFIPQDLLPQLLWLTYKGYDHSYYVDLKPKVTDARIFPDDADHPGGWGTVLIGGFRLGGSCTKCQQGKATPRVVTSDFNGDGNTTSAGDTRVFLSSYFAMDVTNPEKDPVLLWTFRDKNLGLTTSEPTVVRVSPTKAKNPLEKWYVVFGTGPTHHDAETNNPTQFARIYAVDLQNGANYSQINNTSGGSCSPASPCITARRDSQFQSFSTGQPGFMGDVVALDFNLDFNVDAVYAGSVNCNFSGAPISSCNGSNPKWKGEMYRLTTNHSTSLNAWGVSSGPNPVPKPLISTFSCLDSAPTCSRFVGPITSQPSLTEDDNQNIWVFFGTGRFFNNNDKTNADVQDVFGVKDSFLTGTGGDQTVERHNLFDSSQIVVCIVCAGGSTGPVSGDSLGTSTGESLGALLNNLQSFDGWFTTLPGARERNLSPGTIIGGTLFFTTFEPVNDICVAAGNGFLYALYYQTGGAYTTSAIGTQTTGGVTTVSKSLSLGSGLPSQMAVQIGSEGTGTSGTVSGSGCSGRITGFIQASTGVLGQTCGSAAEQFWSRLLSWRDL